MAAYLAVSAAMKSLNCCWDMGAGSPPSSRRRCASAGSLSALTTAACNRAWTAGGVEAGAKRPNQLSRS